MRTEADAIDQLRAAIAHRAVRAGIPRDIERQIRSEVLPKGLLLFESGDPGPIPPDIERQIRSVIGSGVLLFGSGPGPGPMFSSMVELKWAAADIRADGTVGWGPSTRCQFWVRRDDVVRIWPVAPAAPPARGGKKEDYPRSSDGPYSGIREAINDIWPGGIPPRHKLRAKNRDNQILEWLKANGYPTPSLSALPRAVQRVLKAQREQRT